MNFKKFAARATSTVLSLSLLVTSFGSFQTVRAADHRDSGSVDALPEGDLTDVFAFVDPSNTNNVVLILPVDPFTNPSELPSLRFSEEYLYQFKIDNKGNAQEDTVVQFNVHGGRGPQTYDVVIGTPTAKGPHGNVRISGTTLCSGSVNTGAAAGPSMASSVVTDVTTNSKCYAGAADDSFQTDVAQAVFRIGLNPNPSATANAINHTQDVFRGVTLPLSPSFGPLRGRPVRADATSGVDGFGGYDTGIFAISLPKQLLRGTGIRVPNKNSSTLNTANPAFIGAWGTVSRPTSESFDGFETTHSDTYEQFERMGQQLANTVFIFGPNLDGTATFGFTALTYAEVGLPGGNVPLTTNEIKDFFNASGPETDNTFFSRYIPDSLISDGSLIGSLTNSIEGRQTLLTAAGFTAPGGVTGVSLFLPQLPNDIAHNKNKALQRQLLFPDYMRLNLDLLPSLPVERGAGAHNNNDPTLSAASWGIQNGRRPADDATDIILRVNRELDDVKFPANLLVLGLGTGGVAALIPGSGAQGSRHTLQCTQLQVSIVNPQIAVPCEDARIFAVLQGTDFIEQLGTNVENAANQVSQQKLLTTTFPYVGLDPVPGEPGTANFPPQQ